MTAKIRKPITLLCLLSLGLVLFPAPSIAAYEQSAAVNFLKSQPIDEWSAMALASAGALSGVSQDFLKSDPGQSATDIEKRILAIIAAGGDPKILGPVNLIDRLASKFDGSQIGDPGLLNDDIFGLLAFSAAGERPDIRQKLAAHIKANQNVDGGWSYAAGGAPSDSNDTAMAIMALLASGESKTGQSAARGYDYLATTKTPTGYEFDAESGFGPDVSSTAWAMSALAAGGRPAPSSARSYLADQQLADGSFGSFRPATAYALIALGGDFYPVKAKLAAPAPVFKVKIVSPAGAIFDGTVSYQSFSLTDSSGNEHNFSSPRAIGTIPAAAAAAGFNYTIKDTPLGLFVEAIDGLFPAGTKGWQYAVGGVKPSAGAADVLLSDGDEVIWFYGAPNDPPPASASPNKAAGRVILKAEIIKDEIAAPTLTLTASKTSINLGDTVTLNWESQNAAHVVSSAPGGWAGQALGGTVVVQPSQTATYTLTLGGPGGNITKSVTILVDQSPAVVFDVDVSEVDFGALKAGQVSSNHRIKLVNSGKTDLSVTASMENVDRLFQNGLKINSQPWTEYETPLTAKHQRNAFLRLDVPANQNTAGIKTATLIFWASPK